MNAPKKSYKSLMISFVILSIFTFLMIFGLKHNPNFNPSQLVGKPAPDFEAPLAKGHNYKFQNTEPHKSWTILNFWASSCYVCRDEAKDLQDFYQTVSLASASNPQFISINIQDDSSTILQWQKDYAQSFPVLKDEKGLISVNFGVTGTPETFFIDQKNIVRYRVAGPVNKNIILHFIQWLDNNPKASENDSMKQFVRLSAEG